MSALLIELFEKAVHAFPSRVAIEEGTGASITYEELYQRVMRLAHEFAVRADRPRVLICLPKQIDAYAAMFATLISGGFYSPINAGTSIERLRHIINTFRPDIIFTNRTFWQEKMGQEESPSEMTLLFSEEVPFQGRKIETRPPLHELAYTIFTSGSTGTPKGVMISQSAMQSYVEWVLSEFAIEPDDKCAQHTNLGFDISVMDTYGALCSGATLAVINTELERLFPARAIRERRITRWNSVPSVINMMMQARQLDREHLATLRTCVFAGEPLYPEQIEAFFAVRPDLVLYNAYGPTEATVECAAARLTSDNYRELCRSTVSIGKPIGHNRLYLVGGDTSDEGELVIAGPQLAEGYMNDPEKTAAVFRPLPEFGEKRAYFTGDWVRRDEHGNLYFVSRIDFQVKIKGHRLELGEVDAALRKEGLGNVATIADGDRLISFVEGRPEPLDDPSALRQRLRQRLEDYAIPAGFIIVDKLPRNANDKIDVKELIRQFREGRFPEDEMI